jgi:hypothetical protein
MFKMSRVFLALLFCVSIWFPDTAKAFDNNYFKEMFEVYKEHMHPRFLEGIRSRDRKKLKSIKLVLVDDPRAVTLAATVKIKKTIYLSTGFLNGLYNYVDCLLLESQYRNRGICNSYFKYFFDRVVSNNPNLPWPVARIKFGNNDAKIEKWANDDKLENARKTMMFSALGTTFAHELGHHIKGFYDEESTVSESRTIEGKVDRWAFRVLNRMGEKPALGAVITFGYISQMERYRRLLREEHEGDNSFRELTSTHPKPRDRVQWAYDYTCGDEMQGPELRSACNLLEKTIENFE